MAQREKTIGEEIRFESTRNIKIFLEAKSRASGRTRQEVAREQLQALADAYVREVRHAQDLIEESGLSPESPGTSRNRQETAGARRR